MDFFNVFQEDFAIDSERKKVLLIVNAIVVLMSILHGYIPRDIKSVYWFITFLILFFGFVYADRRLGLMMIFILIVMSLFVMLIGGISW